MGGSGRAGLRWGALSEKMYTERLSPCLAHAENSAPGDCSRLSPARLWSHCVGPDLETAQVLERENRNLSSLVLSSPWEPKLPLRCFYLGGLPFRDSVRFPRSCSHLLPCSCLSSPAVPVQEFSSCISLPITSSLSPISDSLVPSCICSATLSKTVRYEGLSFLL